MRVRIRIKCETRSGVRYHCNRYNCKTKQVDFPRSTAFLFWSRLCWIWYVPSIILLTSSDILATAKGTVNLSPSLLVCWCGRYSKWLLVRVQQDLQSRSSSSAHWCDDRPTQTFSAQQSSKYTARCHSKGARSTYQGNFAIVSVHCGSLVSK